LKLFLWPGDLIAGLAGLPEGSDNRMVLRLYANVVIWAAIAAIILAMIYV
jgi:hypothetical protein